MGRSLLVGLATGLVACAAFGASDDGGANVPGNVDGGPTGAAGQADGAPGSLVGPAQDLATDQHRPSDILVDATSVYWLNRPSAGKNGELVKTAKTGGLPVVLTHDLMDPSAIAMDSTDVFIADNDVGGEAPYQYNYQNIYRQDTGGEGPAKKQLTANDRLLGCIVHGRSVFWALAGNGGSVGLVDADPWKTSTSVSLAGQLGTIKVLAVDPAYVYVGGTDQITRVSRSGEPSVVFAKTHGDVSAIVLDAATSRLYWAEGSSIRSLDTASPGGVPTDLAANEDAPPSIAIDAANVYWTDYAGGTIRTVPKAGGAPSTLASGENEPLGIAVDSAGLYWTNHGDGRVRVLRH